MKNTLAIVTLSSLLAACANAPVARAPAQAKAEVTVPAATPVAAPPAAPASTPKAAPTPAEAASAAIAALTAEPLPPKAGEDGLPQVPLTADLMARLLSAEIAFQRGEWEAAYMTHMAAAQQTRDPRLARRAAEMAISAKANGEALAAVRLWHELAPQSDEAAQYLLGLIVMSEELDAALPMFEKRLADAAPETRGLMLLQIQRMLARAQDKAAAFAMLEQLAEPWTRLAEAHVALAQGAAAAGDSPRAIAEAHKALGINADSELAALTLAQVQPDKAAAMRSLAQYIAAHPKSREVRLALARMQIEQKQFAKARAEFEAILKHQPDDLSSLYALGVLASQAGDWRAAEKHLGDYVKSLAEHPQDDRDPTQALLLLAQIAEEHGDYSRALGWLGQVEQGGAYIPTLVKRALLTAKQGKLEEALALLRGTRSENEAEQVQLIGGEATLLRDARRPKDALAVIQAGLQRYPDQPDLLYDLSMVAEKDGQFDLMERTLRRLIEVAPTNQHAYNALGYSLADRNIRLDEAHRLIETALSHAPEDPFILDSLGWVLYRQGKLREAEEALRRSYGMRQDAEIAVHLGEVLWAQGRKDEAQKYWREARSKDPENATLKSTLARLHAHQ